MSSWLRSGLPSMVMDQETGSWCGTMADRVPLPGWRPNMAASVEQRKPEGGRRTEDESKPEAELEPKPEPKPKLQSTSTPASKRSTVHILVPSGSNAGLVRACLPQIQPALAASPGPSPCRRSPLDTLTNACLFAAPPGRSSRAKRRPATARLPTCLTEVPTRFPSASLATKLPAAGLSPATKLPGGRGVQPPLRAGPFKLLPP